MKLLPTKKKLHDDYTLTTTVCLGVYSVTTVRPRPISLLQNNEENHKKNRKLKIEFKKILK